MLFRSGALFLTQDELHYFQDIGCVSLQWKCILDGCTLSQIGTSRFNIARRTALTLARATQESAAKHADVYSKVRFHRKDSFGV